MIVKEKKRTIQGFDFENSSKEIVRYEIYARTPDSTCLSQCKPHQEKITTEIIIPNNLLPDLAELISNYIKLGG